MVCRLSARLGERLHGVSGPEELPQCPPQVLRLTPAAPSPFSQSDPGQFDEVSHAGAQEDGLLVTVPCPIITLYLLHHELGMPQERILCESIQVEHTRRNSGLSGEKTWKCLLGLSKTSLRQTNM